MHGEGLEVLSGERQKRLQETIIATETGCVVLDEEEDEIQEKVCEVESLIGCIVLFSCRRGCVNSKFISGGVK